MEIIKSLKSLPYLSKVAISTALNKNPNTLRNLISYYKQKGVLISLKRGFYVFREYIEKSDNSLYYPRFVATKMIEPSYISKELILQDYEMLTEAVPNYSIVTTKKTVSIKNEFGNFYYQSIKPELFKGFTKKKYGDMVWYEATKAKALFDYFYFNLNKFSRLEARRLDSLRFNFEQLKKKDWQEFKKYLRLAPAKMAEIYYAIK